MIKSILRLIYHKALPLPKRTFRTALLWRIGFTWNLVLASATSTWQVMLWLIPEPAYLSRFRMELRFAPLGEYITRHQHQNNFYRIGAIQMSMPARQPTMFWNLSGMFCRTVPISSWQDIIRIWGIWLQIIQQTSIATRDQGMPKVWNCFSSIILPSVSWDGWVTVSQNRVARIIQMLLKGYIFTTKHT